MIDQGEEHRRSAGVEEDDVFAVVLSSVVIFEILGPLCVRYAVVHAGEVKIVNLIPERIREGLGENLP